MKTYEVITVPAVHVSIFEAYQYIAEDSPANAKRWLQGLYTAIESLETMPTRCPAIRERVGDGVEYRELHFKSHRLIFNIVEAKSLVQIHALRHAARDEWKPNEG